MLSNPVHPWGRLRFVAKKPNTVQMVLNKLKTVSRRKYNIKKMRNLINCLVDSQWNLCQVITSTQNCTYYLWGIPHSGTCYRSSGRYSFGATFCFCLHGRRRRPHQDSESAFLSDSQSNSLGVKPLVGFTAIEMLCPAVLAHLSDFRVGLSFPRSHRLLQLYVFPRGKNTLKITK